MKELLVGLYRKLFNFFLSFLFCIIFFSIYKPIIPRVTIPTSPSLYSQQTKIVNKERKFWSVNLRTAMDNRTPPVSPSTPYQNNQQFFTKY